MIKGKLMGGFVGVLALAAMGCSSQPLSNSDEAVGESLAEIVYEVAFSDTGRLSVVRGQDGVLSVNVTGAIGADDDAVGARAIGKSTLEEVYLALMPNEADVPAPLASLSKEFKAQQDEALALAAGRASEQLPTVEQQAARGVAKDFWSQACQTFVESGVTWVPLECRLNSCNAVSLPCYAETSWALMGTNDRSYAWNATNYSAYHGTTGPGGSHVVPRYTWQWGWWGGSYSNANAWVSHDFLATNSAGQMGITVHDYR
jgi:hypothetical protein